MTITGFIVINGKLIGRKPLSKRDSKKLARAFDNAAIAATPFVPLANLPRECTEALLIFSMQNLLTP